MNQMKAIYCLLLLMSMQLLMCGKGYTQPTHPDRSFQLNGTIDADTGTVLLLPIAGEAFHPATANVYKASIKQGTFTFKGQMAYPGGFLIAFFPNYVSSPFIVEAGTQSIVCLVDSAREIPRIDNGSMRELKAAPVNFFSRLIVSAKQKTRLLDYTRQHPDSYVALWETVRQLEVGYVPILDSVYAAFSTSLKNNHTGKLIARRLASARVTAIGKVFPAVTLLDTDQKPVAVKPRSGASYTLVDFWYSRCTACLEEFPQLTNLFQLYRNKGFDIVGISIDKPVDSRLWVNTIEKRKLGWRQYLDLSGKFTLDELSIGYFPSNFLLDEKGTIINRNIRPDELSKFLAENL
ncbi:hypothetical protein GCM10027185_29800 [Spirosoma pulveris]